MRKESILSLLKESPNDSFLHFALAKEFEKEADFKKAIQEYEWIRENDPAYVGLYYHLAAAAIELDQDENYISAVFRQGVEVAMKLNDHHALGELKNAQVNWEMGL